MTYLLLILLLVVGCNDTQTNASIVGDWQRNYEFEDEIITIQLSYNEDGTASGIMGELEGNGTYTISDGIITVLDEDCGLENEGNYSYTVSSTQLTLTLINDVCDENCEEYFRVRFLSDCSTAVWTRIE